MDLPGLSDIHRLAHSPSVVSRSVGCFVSHEKHPSDDKRYNTCTICGTKKRQQKVCIPHLHDVSGTSSQRLPPGFLLDDEKNLLDSVRSDRVSVNQLEGSCVSSFTPLRFERDACRGCLDLFNPFESDPHVARRFGLAHNLLEIDPTDTWHLLRTLSYEIRSAFPKRPEEAAPNARP